MEKNRKKSLVLIIGILVLALVVFLTTRPQEKQDSTIHIQVMEEWIVEIIPSSDYQIITNGITPCIMQEVNTGEVYRQSLVKGRYEGFFQGSGDSVWLVKTDCQLTLNSTLPILVRIEPTEKFWIDALVFPLLLILSGVIISVVFRKKS